VTIASRDFPLLVTTRLTRWSMLMFSESSETANLSEPTLRMDCRVIGERSDAVLRTTMPGNDDVRIPSRDTLLCPSLANYEAK
jgi:hypothetical protein